MFFFLMTRRTPISTRSDTLFPYTTLFRSTIRTLLVMAAACSALSTQAQMVPEMTEGWEPTPAVIEPGKVAADGMVSAPSDAFSDRSVSGQYCLNMETKT